MKLVCKRLALGLALIIAASLVLLLSDWKRRAGRGAATTPQPARPKTPSIATFQFATRPVIIDGAARANAAAVAATLPTSNPNPMPRPLPGKTFSIGLAYYAPEAGADAAIGGLLDGLRAAGFVEGTNLVVRRVHAQAETAAIPVMLQMLDASEVDAVATLTTPVLQGAIGNVRRKPVVFFYVTDPITAGAGKSFTDHLPGLTGVGSFPPLADTVELMRRLFPGRRQLGVLYNAGEANSVKVVTSLRPLIAGIGWTLTELTAASTSEILQAAQVMVSRQVAAVYIPGDNTAYQAFDAILKTTRDARVPLIIDAPEFNRPGVLAVAGVGYRQCGLAAAERLARVLLGTRPADIPLTNVTEKRIILNVESAAALGFTFTPEARQMEETGPLPPAPVSNSPAAPWRLYCLNFSESSFTEEAMKGVREGFASAGLTAGRDYTLRVVCAQGDVATLNTMLDAAVDDRAQLILLTSTTALQAAAKKVRRVPVVFGNVANPVLAGAGSSDTEHLSNITGVSTLSDFEGLARVLRQCLPQARRAGTLFVPSELNCVFNKDRLAEALRRIGIDLVAKPVATPSEVPDAALALAAEDLDVVCQVNGNLLDTATAAIALAVRKEHKPLFAFTSGFVEKGGATLAVARDYEQAGRDMTALAVRILRGESPASIPFQTVSRTRLLINLENARLAGLRLPEAVLKGADQVLER
jgi:ABC-type uncharacterized transport system substrate-binding protein